MFATTEDLGVQVIAEAGVNHNGDVTIARELVRIAAWSGADYVKFQTFVPELVVTPDAARADYQKSTDTQEDETQLALIKNLCLSFEDFKILKADCEKYSIGFMSTAFDLNSLVFLDSIGVKVHKIPSGEITNLPYLRTMAGFGKPVLMSTGMADLAEIGAAIEVLCNAGLSSEMITILHCTTQYPAQLSGVNLKALDLIANTFGLPVGYSDHTSGTEISVAAVGRGAMVIEKHFTLDRAMDGPDHAASLEPAELARLVAEVRNVSKALGKAEKVPTETELEMKPIVRRSIVASRDIETGEIFSAENLVAKRPGTGLSPMFWDDVIGRPAKRFFRCNEIIEL